MASHRFGIAEITAELPPEWPDDPLPEIRRQLATASAKVVVLDDDPTGTQTVHDVSVLTEWSVDSLKAELLNDLPAFYILTNSRSVSQRQAQQWNREIARNLRLAAVRTGRPFVVVSRSDSTLRGHFPGEVDALVEGLGAKPDGILLIPFFQEGGRFTIRDVHYVADGNTLVPAAETEFARDPVFGYRHSNLRDWVEEKTAGRVSAQSVRSISLDTIRRSGPEAVARGLASLTDGTICIVNAASFRDVAVFTLGLLLAERGGKRFLYRTAASFVPARCGMAGRDLLTPGDLALADAGGLIVAGSFVPRTTEQIQVLRADTDTATIELETARLLEEKCRQAYIAQAAARTTELLRAGHDVMLHTSRRRLEGADAEDSLNIGKRISQALVDLVRGIPVRPRYILAKGGITSSDIATAALGVRRAMVKGQILPGVPLWELGPESRYPGLPYVVFPGNVGDARALLTVVRSLGRSASRLEVA